MYFFFVFHRNLKIIYCVRSSPVVTTLHDDRITALDPMSDSEVVSAEKFKAENVKCSGRMDGVNVCPHLNL
jgi:hypothetical protein